MKTPPANIKLPDLPWKRNTCPVCGRSFQHLSRSRPRTCRSGECRYKYDYKIDRENWADYQPTFL
ncbi:MAG: hypothetical protein AB1644_01655 [Candidatus Zixiibacteriota bacterium]